MEREVIADIARRVKKTGRYTETAEIMAKSMVEQGFSADKIQAEVMKLLRADKDYQREVAENTKAYKQEIQDIIDETVQEAKKAGKKLTAEAGNMAWNNDLSMWQQAGVDLSKPNTMSQLKNAFTLQTVGELRNLTRTTGFKDTAFGSTGIMNMYQREMDHALIKVASGAFSYDQAVDDCVHRLAQSGLRSIDYASGRTYQIDTAARMSVRTGLNQLAGKITEANIDSTGVKLVITSQHAGSRPEHVTWQNKVFSYDGKNKRYPDFVSSTGYGSAGGLMGVNCAHSFSPFWEGISIIPKDIKEPDPVTVDGKEYTYYQATQKQRSMERNIRATKREIEAQRAIGGDTKELRAKLRKQMADYKQFSAGANLRAKDNRLRVSVGTSNLNGTNKKISKAITISDVSVASKNSGMSESAVNEIQKVLEKNEGLGCFANITFKNLSENQKNVAFETVTTKIANWCESSLVVNTSFLSGKSVQEINNLFNDSTSTVCNSMEEGILHEIYHAKLADRLQFSEYNRLCNTKGLEKISRVAENDLSESIAEIGVLKERGDFSNISEDAKKLFEKYFEV